MKYKVDIYADSNLISSDYWYGSSIQDVKFWIELVIRDILQNTNFKHIEYYVNEAE